MAGATCPHCKVPMKSKNIGSKGASFGDTQASGCLLLLSLASCATIVLIPLGLLLFWAGIRAQTKYKWVCPKCGFNFDKV